MIWKNRKILKNNYENIRNEWLNCLIYYIHNFNNLDEQTMEKFKETFMKRSLSYWKKYRLKSAKKCEQELINFTYELNRRINNEIIN